MWGYHGSKWSSAKKYPLPKYDTIVEPFAGSAGYALNYPDRKVILVEINPNIVAIWKLLQKNYKLDQRLPKEIKPGTKVLEMKVDEEVRMLMHYKTCAYHSHKQFTFSSRGADQWLQIRKKILSQAAWHWDIRCGTFEDLELKKPACYFVDPPYAAALVKSGAGHYEFETIDYGLLGAHCLFKWRGQVTVCEQAGADWLPFEHLYSMNAQSQHGSNLTSEVIYYREDCNEPS